MWNRVAERLIKVANTFRKFQKIIVSGEPGTYDVVGRLYFGEFVMRVIDNKWYALSWEYWC
jgi:hypothetical protein